MASSAPPPAPSPAGSASATYLFRLFPTKRALFLAAVECTFAQVKQAFRDAAESRTGDDAKVATSVAYEQLLAERTLPRMQMQAYATSVDAEVRELNAPHVQPAGYRSWCLAG